MHRMEFNLENEVKNFKKIFKVTDKMFSTSTEPFVSLTINLHQRNYDLHSSDVNISFYIMDMAGKKHYQVLYPCRKAEGENYEILKFSSKDEVIKFIDTNLADVIKEKISNMKSTNPISLYIMN